MPGREFLRRLEQGGASPRRMSFRKGEIVFRQGDPGVALVVVLSGKVELTIHTPEGKAVGLATVGPGELFGELALTETDRYVTARAVTDVEASVVRADHVKAAAQKDPGVLEEVLALMSTRLQDAARKLGALVSRPLGVRLAGRLLDLAGEDPSTKELCVRMTQQDLAAAVGATREAVNRELRGFERRGWVELNRGRIVLRRPTELSDRAGLSGNQP